MGDRVRRRTERVAILLAKVTHGKAPGPVLASTLALGLAVVTALNPLGLKMNAPPAVTMLGGLVLFGIVFALNSSVHSYLVLAYSEADRVSLSVGYYYMANACGRLLGTLLSGVLYHSRASPPRCGEPSFWQRLQA